MADFRAQFARVTADQLRKYQQRRRVPKAFLEKTAEALRDEMIESMRKGISPIDRNGRFPAYKNPTRYPDGVRDLFPNKRRRPVNLFLSGDFYKNLKFKIVGDARFKFGSQRGPEIEVGYFDRENALKEEGHREGAGGQPKRPTIPQSGEAFSRKIIDRITKKLVDFLNS